MLIAPLAEYEVAWERGYHGDHAAKWEPRGAFRRVLN